MRRQSAILWLAVAVVVVLMVYLLHLHSTAPVGSQASVHADNDKAGGHVVVGKTPSQGEAKQAVKVYRVRPNQLLAEVNNTPITLLDLMPLQSTNNAEQQIDPVAYNYFLQRAINRELIMQAAQARGITLTESQQQQLDKLRAEREEPEPGLVSKLTVNSTAIEFDLRDEQAFMLQTSLMAAAGLTPNVTPEQVEQYYQQHMDEFGALPTDPQASQQAWQAIDFQIRGLLAAGARAGYQQALNQYMDGLKANANIVTTPLTETLMNAQ